MYEKSISLPTNVENFTKNLQTIFLNLDFEIQNDDTYGFTMINKTNRLRTKPYIIWGISSITVKINESNITIISDMKKIKTNWFPCVIIAELFVIALGIIEMSKNDVSMARGLVGCLAVVIFFTTIGMLGYYGIEKTTKESINSAINNALVLSNGQAE